MPLTKGLLLIIVSLFIWWHLSSIDKKEKKKLLSFTGDVLSYFLALVFLFQFLLFFPDVVASPYQLLLPRASATGWALISLTGYIGFKYRNHPFCSFHLYKEWVRLLMAGAAVNHLYYAWVYGNLSSILSAALCMAGLFVMEKIRFSFSFLLVLTFGISILQLWMLKKTVLIFELVFPVKALWFSIGIWFIIISATFMKRRRSSSIPKSP